MALRHKDMIAANPDTTLGGMTITLRQTEREAHLVIEIVRHLHGRNFLLSVCKLPG